jgi:hypothetical protein
MDRYHGFGVDTGAEDVLGNESGTPAATFGDEEQGHFLSGLDFDGTPKPAKPEEGDEEDGEEDDDADGDDDGEGDEEEMMAQARQREDARREGYRRDRMIDTDTDTITDKYAREAAQIAVGTEMAHTGLQILGAPESALKAIQDFGNGVGMPCNAAFGHEVLRLLDAGIVVDKIIANRVQAKIMRKISEAKTRLYAELRAQQDQAEVRKERGGVDALKDAFLEVMMEIARNGKGGGSRGSIFN